MLNETLLAAYLHSAATPPALRAAYQSLARFPQAVAVLRRISHARFCSCFFCVGDLLAAEDEAERVRADSEDQSETDRDIDFVRAMGGAA